MKHPPSIRFVLNALAVGLMVCGLAVADGGHKGNFIGFARLAGDEDLDERSPA